MREATFFKGQAAVAEQTLKVAIVGATGRMGARLIQLIDADPLLSLGAAIERADHQKIGQEVGPLVGLGPLGVMLTATLEKPVDVAIDFSSPKATLAFAKRCAELRVPLVIGTTGFEPEERKQLEEAAKTIPVLLSSNFSKGVNLLMALVKAAARALGQDADVEIVERHHHFKKDAPSGTALRLAEIVAKEIHSEKFVHGRSGQVGERPRGEIGVHALRVGDNPGEHVVVFGMLGDCLELSHRALNRDGFAYGALEAAKVVARKPPGFYAMEDVLNLGI